uniref:Uncharacterized protein n=1 Tax=Arundo donax TaxID=35708 RepID=A0A0A9A4N0_ARUDO
MGIGVIYYGGDR